jgi:hypothetical protein
MDALALSVTVVLLLLALLHAYWAVGGVWPGHDKSSLADIVVGGPIGLRMPSPAACAAVTLVLVLASGLVLAARGLVALPLPSALLHVGALAVAFILTLRGAGGFFEARLRPSITRSRYARLNTRFYSPLALGLGLATLAVAL